MDLMVRLSALEGVAGDIGAAVAALAARLEELDGSLAPLKTDWAGSAQEAYVSAKAQWDAQIRELSAALDRSRSAVMSSAAAYAAADRRGAALFGR